ncbi:DNA-binding response regulator, partial [Bacillus paralicheniformis]|nr:DNA-binding response regulator [Bacillus paralicheniformis]
MDRSFQSKRRRSGVYRFYTEGEANTKGGIHLIDILIAEDDFRVAQIHERLIEQL